MDKICKLSNLCKNKNLCCHYCKQACPDRCKDDVKSCKWLTDSITRGRETLSTPIKTISKTLSDEQKRLKKAESRKRRREARKKNKQDK